jgi:hypothetical protein
MGLASAGDSVERAVDLGRSVLLSLMMRRPTPTTERSMTRGEATLSDHLVLDVVPAIRE